MPPPRPLFPLRPLVAAVAIVALLALPACDPDEGRLTLRDVDRYHPALLQEALEPSYNDGRINHEILKGHYRETLDLLAHHLPDHGPRTDPSLFRFPRQKLAFYTNAHNALALLAWLRSGSADGDPQRVWDPAWDAEEHAIDGQRLSLDDLVARVRAQGEQMRSGGGREAELLLSRGRRDSPRFAPLPYDGQLYESQLREQLRALLNREDAFEDTQGEVVGPAWLRTLTEPLDGDLDASGGPPPLDDAALTAFLHEHLLYENPLRLPILRAAREGRLVPGPVDPRVAPPLR